MKQMRFTKAAVEALPAAAAGKRQYIYDEEVPGLQVAVTDRGAKTYYVYRKIQGRPRRIKLGQHPDLSPAMARSEAYQILAQIARGQDPQAQRRQKRARQVSLQQAFDSYLETHRLKPKTQADYSRLVQRAFGSWLNRPVVEINKSMVAKRQAQLGEQSGPYYANQAMRVLRAILNHAAIQWEDAQGQPLIIDNPVRRLSATRSWFPTSRRATFVKPAQLPAWFEAVLAHKDDGPGTIAETTADYLLVLLLTGLRREEAARLEWQRVDLQDRTLTVVDTKNHDDHTLPLSDYLHSLLSDRAAAASGPWVFPGTGPAGYLVESRYQRAKVINASGIEFTLHDLRRTFITAAERLEVPHYALKKLLNHRLSGDVTGGYIRITVERLRDPMQRITDYFLAAGGIRGGATITHLDRVKADG